MRIKHVREIGPLQHWVSLLHLELLALRGLDRHPIPLDCNEPGAVGIEQSPLVIVARPADPVTQMNLELAPLEQRQIVVLASLPHPGGPERMLPATLVLNPNDAFRLVDAADSVLAASEPQSTLGLRDLEHHAGPVRDEVPEFLARQVDAVEHLERDLLGADFPVGLQSALDRLVDS